jgi:hypothetical protein
MIAAVVAASALTLRLPDALRLAPPWVLPLVEGALVVILVLGDPGRIDNRSRLLRGVSVTLVVVMASSATWSTLRLIDDITGGGAETNSASALLRNGSSVWATTVVAFALLFFERDSGGPAVRAHGSPAFPDLAFPQHLNPDLRPPGWHTRFLDYLYLALTNSTAFSPTDVMPMVRWMKALMAVQSLVSLAIIGLVLARGVNVLS